MSSSVQPYGRQLTKLFSSWDSPGQNTEVGCHALLQRVFSTQGLNLWLLWSLHWQVASLLQVPSGKPDIGLHTLKLLISADIYYYSYSFIVTFSLSTFELKSKHWDIFHLKVGEIDKHVGDKFILWQGTIDMENLLTLIFSFI